jgi:VCBS repeat-containing protein
VLGNDTDADGDSLTAAGATQPANGAVTLNSDGSFTYTPDTGFSGTDTFTYQANDGTVDAAAATVTITVDPPAAPVETAISGSAAAFTYGSSGTVWASITPATATGTVEVLEGSTVLGSGSVSNGNAGVVLPAKSLLPGTHRLTLRYTGDAAHLASSTTVTVVVHKVVPRMNLHAPEEVQVGDRPTLKVVLAADAGLTVTGRIEVTVDGGKPSSVKLTDERVVVKLPKAARAGTMEVKVVYLGSDMLARVADTISIRVIR